MRNGMVLMVWVTEASSGCGTVPWGVSPTMITVPGNVKKVRSREISLPSGRRAVLVPGPPRRRLRKESALTVLTTVMR
ncbi:hypothetical protein GCM10009527_011820 [Actinomadura nitritigenes]